MALVPARDVQRGQWVGREFRAHEVSVILTWRYIINPNTVSVLVGILLIGIGYGEAGQGSPRVQDEARGTYDGPPRPVPPAVISRDSAGRATVRAVRIESPLEIDGRLDEPVYEDERSISGFIQNEPREGDPASEKTDVWIFYDHDTFYVVARCWETQPERMVANEMRRDNINIVRNDQFAFTLDTFYDRRNAFLFEIGAAGGRIDGQVTNERQINLDWNPVWRTVVGRFDGGWTVEAAIPFKSLRYQPGSSQIWGIQLRRLSKWRNESAFLTPVPASAGDAGQWSSQGFWNNFLRFLAGRFRLHKRVVHTPAADTTRPDRQSADRLCPIRT